jgi:hypothetical protein
MPAFVGEIRGLFSAQSIRDHLDYLESTRYLAPQEVNLRSASDDGLEEEDVWLDDPVMSGEELLRYSRIRELLRAGSHDQSATKSSSGEQHPRGSHSAPAKKLMVQLQYFSGVSRLCLRGTRDLGRHLNQCAKVNRFHDQCVAGSFYPYPHLVNLNAQ